MAVLPVGAVTTNEHPIFFFILLFRGGEGGLAHLGPNTRTTGKRGMLLGGSPKTQEKTNTLNNFVSVIIVINLAKKYWNV